MSLGCAIKMRSRPLASESKGFAFGVAQWFGLGTSMLEVSSSKPLASESKGLPSGSNSSHRACLVRVTSPMRFASYCIGAGVLPSWQVKEFEELRTNTLQENQLLKAKIQVLQTQVYNLKKSAGPPCLPTGHEMNTPENGDLNSEVVATQALVDKLIDENAELVEKVKNLYVELERRGPPMEVSSYLDADVITTSSEAARIANESALGSHKIPGAVHEHVVDHTTEPKSQPSEAVLQSSERLQSLKDTIDKAVSDDEHVSKIDSRNAVNLSEIESDEIVQIPLDENEVQSADLEVTSVDQDQYEEVPLTNAPLIGAPFRLISFFARYVSGADLVNKNSATSNR
ncbi:hypothetical protein KY285_037625 [Solanum tuberosum]|nr:hypothetical protein KY285_037625 [Solanum tuberosum]